MAEKSAVEVAAEKCLAVFHEVDTAARDNEIGCFDIACIPADSVPRIITSIEALRTSGPDDAVMRAWGSSGGSKASASLVHYLNPRLQGWEGLEHHVLSLLTLYPRAYKAHPEYLDAVLAEDATVVVQSLLDTLEATSGVAPEAVDVVPVESEKPEVEEGGGEEGEPEVPQVKAELQPPAERAVACVRALDAIVCDERTKSVFQDLGGPAVVLDAVYYHQLNPITLPF